MFTAARASADIDAGKRWKSADEWIDWFAANTARAWNNRIGCYGHFESPPAKSRSKNYIHNSRTPSSNATILTVAANADVPMHSSKLAIVRMLPTESTL